MTFQPPATQPSLPGEVEDFLLKIPAVCGFRWATGPEQKRVIVMVATAAAATALPKSLAGYILEPEVTGSFRTY